MNYVPLLSSIQQLPLVHTSPSPDTTYTDCSMILGWKVGTRKLLVRLTSPMVFNSPYPHGTH